MNEQNPDDVVAPNLIPLNKAKKLYLKKEPFLPDIYDFIGKAKIGNEYLKDI